MAKLTKIIATIGPSSDSEELIEDLINLGVNIFRFNFKHSDLDWHKERIKRVANVRTKLNKNISTLLDLQGPEIRLSLPFEYIDVERGQKILFSKEIFETNEKGICVNPIEIIKTLKDDQKVLIDDGLFEFRVKRENGKTYLISHTTGRLLNKKAVSIENLTYDFPVLHDRDREGLRLAKEMDVDFIALSFVRNVQDIKTLRDEMKKLNLFAKIVAKIETLKAVKNIDEIIEATDAIMIARGDMGVELSLEEVPFYQKEIIKKCIQKGVPVVTATQMLESMTKNPIPTRAEVSDVANAIYDYTDCIMLSGETANGIYPKETVSLMARVAYFSEDKNRIHDIRTVFDYELEDKSEMVCDSAFNLYKSLKAKDQPVKGFLTFTQSGKTSRMLSRYRPHVPIFAFCPSNDLVRRLTISYGVQPIFQKSLKEKNEIVKDDIQLAINILKEEGFAEVGDTFIVLHGDYWTSESGTSTIRLISA